MRWGDSWVTGDEIQCRLIEPLICSPSPISHPSHAPYYSRFLYKLHYFVADSTVG